MRAKSDEPAQQRDDALPPKRPPAPNLERRQPAHSSVTTELDLIFNPFVGREGIDASSFPRPPNVFQSTMGTAGGCHGILLQCLEIFALYLDPCREWPSCNRTYYNNYAHGLPSVSIHPNTTSVPLWPLSRPHFEPRERDVG